jgi:hypothetical protein
LRDSINLLSTFVHTLPFILFPTTNAKEPAEYIFETTGILSDYESMMRTRDIDVLVRNLRKPPERTDFLDRMKAAGFVIDTSRGTGVNCFHNYDADMEVEFLLQEKGQGQPNGYSVESLGIRVPALRDLDILAAFPVTVEYGDDEIVVPTPEAYIIHKLVINRHRSEDKRQKDIESVALLMGHISDGPRLALFVDVWNNLTKKQRKAALDVVGEQALLTNLQKCLVLE